MRLILASESPGRKKVLEDEGLSFEVIPSNFVEEMDESLLPHELTAKLSIGKARSVATLHPDAVIIGADTVAVFNNQILGKPHTEDTSIEMLSMLSGNVHSMVTGLTVIRGENEITKVIETKLRFREIPLEEIIAYTKSGEALKKAGAYAYQLTGHKFVEHIDGSITNIMGLPIEELRRILGELDK